MAMANNGRKIHYIKHATTSKACLGQRKGSQFVEWWPSSQM
jgi:hypothetical protein